MEANIEADTDLSHLIDTQTYPLNSPTSSTWQELVETTRQQLKNEGCSVLKSFILPSMHEQLMQEGEALAPKAYYTVETVNVYNTDPYQAYPENHPAGIQFERGNAFVARDLIPENNLVQQLYINSYFKQFIAACFETETIHELADPLAGLCINVLQPQREHPWHFDTNEFTVSLLTKPAENGGAFQYYPNIRSPESENTDEVFNVITGQEQASKVVRTLDLQCGDLQLFKGRYALHRVSPVEGRNERHTAILAYTPLPNVIGSVERTKQLFGRVLPAHYAAENDASRADALMD